MTKKSDDAAVAKANLVEHLKNIAIACNDARLPNLEKNSSIKEEVQKAQDCSAPSYRKRAAVRTGPKAGKALGAEDK